MLAIVCIVATGFSLAKGGSSDANATSVNIFRDDADSNAKQDETEELDINKARELFVNAVDVHIKWFSKPAVSETDTLKNAQGRVFKAVTEGFTSKSQLRDELRKYLSEESCNYIIDNNYIESDGKLYFSVIGMGFPGKLEFTGDSLEKTATGWSYKIYYHNVDNGKKGEQLIYEKEISLVDGNYVFGDFYADIIRFRKYVYTLLEESRMEPLELTDALQYSVNYFLSRFSRADIAAFDGEPMSRDAVNMALDMHFRNLEDRESLFEKLDGTVTLNSNPYNYRIESSIVNEAVQKYFTNVQTDENYGKELYNYKDGYYYYTFTGGLAMFTVSVGTSVNKVDEDVYKIEFKRYRVEPRTDDIYSYNEEQIQAATNIGKKTYEGSGTAYIKASDINNPEACSLMSYVYTDK